jgi:hypothetical protein
MTQENDDRVLHVRSNADRAVLEVDGANIRLSRPGLDASVVVYQLETGEITRGLASFIASLARNPARPGTRTPAPPGSVSRR